MSRWCMMLLLTVFSALQLYAQKEEITVTGTVKDTKGENPGGGEYCHRKSTWFGSGVGYRW